jgi:hypothetical protein
MRHEYGEKNGIIITYSNRDVSFEERETAMSILISNDGTVLHSNFTDDPEKTKNFGSSGVMVGKKCHQPQCLC